MDAVCSDPPVAQRKLPPKKDASHTENNQSLWFRYPMIELCIYYIYNMYIIIINMGVLSELIMDTEDFKFRVSKISWVPEIKSGWEKSGLNRICHGKLGFKLEGLISKPLFDWGFDMISSSLNGKIPSLWNMYIYICIALWNAQLDWLVEKNGGLVEQVW